MNRRIQTRLEHLERLIQPPDDKVVYRYPLRRSDGTWYWAEHHLQPGERERWAEEGKQWLIAEAMKLQGRQIDLANANGLSLMLTGHYAELVARDEQTRGTEWSRLAAEKRAFAGVSSDEDLIRSMWRIIDELTEHELRAHAEAAIAEGLLWQTPAGVWHGAVPIDDPEQFAPQPTWLLAGVQRIAQRLNQGL